MKTAKKKKTISLVLGSGGARGLSHIGVIRWLIEHDYQINAISGCSIGALIGGVYAAGKLDEFEQWICEIDRFEILSLLDLAWKSNGLVQGDKIINTLVKLLGDQQIQDLPIRYTAVAADIEKEKEVWINRGSLFEAIRASISLPLFFTPVLRNGVLLIDGGVLNPVPIAPIFNDNNDLSVAVNLGGVVAKTINPIEKEKKKIETTGFHMKVLQFISSFKEEKVDLTSKDWGAYDIANQAFDAMQSTIARQKLAAYPADIVIEIARNACGTLEFDRAREMIDLGYQAAEQRFSTAT
ncbi:serine protease [Psychromonas sp. psych-6C06]|uniref:patatin-like phospholipase family protein n=1 Tax=Psychromonas sp. psych-6C06 TaxID=2058089 RepID=UPI000C31F0B6|nr:patatin-like phospholipase family protein [Psychromonas sp. psych-6C06]PKF63815.1 serine protease [Psychromonas sp. psych-6C06]